jgi:hypothetical protein
MNIGPDKVDLSALTPAEERFITAANEHVSALTRSWQRRLLDRYRARRERRTANRAAAGAAQAAPAAEDAPGTGQ